MPSSLQPAHDAGTAARPRRASRLEVGSSRISTLAEMSIARAIATICWTASEYVPTAARSTSMSRSSAREQLRGPPAHLAPVDPAEPARLAADEDVLRHRQVRAEVDLLVDGADPGLLRLQRAGEAHRLAVQRDRAGVDRVDAGQHLDQRRLAGAVLAHQGVDLAGEEPEVDVVERRDAGERLADPRHRQDRRGSAIVRPCPRVGTRSRRPRRGRTAEPRRTIGQYWRVGSAALACSW